jgi:hypothetical protein
VTRVSLLLLLALVPALAAPGACQPLPGPTPPPSPTGGAPATGGTAATGGSATGGTAPSGGTAGTGGTPAPSTAELLCGHLADIGCAEGDGSCVTQAQALLDLQAEGRARFDVVCLSTAATPAQAQACGSILCGGSQ